MLPGMQHFARGSLRPRYLMSFIEHQPEPVSMGDRQPGLSQPRVYDRFSALTVWCNQGILRLSPSSRPTFLAKRLLRGGHFHFMVHPTGAVSVVGGSLPSRTASSASLK